MNDTIDLTKSNIIKILTKYNFPDIKILKKSFSRNRISFPYTDPYKKYSLHKDIEIEKFGGYDSTTYNWITGEEETFKKPFNYHNYGTRQLFIVIIEYIWPENAMISLMMESNCWQNDELFNKMYKSLIRTIPKK